MSDTTTATAEQTRAITALVTGAARIGEAELTIAVKGFNDTCDLYKDVSDAFWAAIRAIGADDADKAGPASLTLLADLSRGKFKVDTEVKGQKVKGTVSKATVSRLRTMQHDSPARRNKFKQIQVSEGKSVTFGPYVTYLSGLANKTISPNGELTDDAAKDKAKRERAAAARAKQQLVADFNIDSFVNGASKIEKLADLYKLQHDLDFKVKQAEKGLSDAAKAQARADVVKAAKRAAGQLKD